MVLTQEHAPTRAQEVSGWNRLLHRVSGGRWGKPPVEDGLDTTRGAVGAALAEIETPAEPAQPAVWPERVSKTIGGLGIRRKDVIAFDDAIACVAQEGDCILINGKPFAYVDLAGDINNRMIRVKDGGGKSRAFRIGSSDVITYVGKQDGEAVLASFDELTSGKVGVYEPSAVHAQPAARGKQRPVKEATWPDQTATEIDFSSATDAEFKSFCEALYGLRNKGHVISVDGQVCELVWLAGHESDKPNLKVRGANGREETFELSFRGGAKVQKITYLGAQLPAGVAMTEFTGPQVSPDAERGWQAYLAIGTEINAAKAAAAKALEKPAGSSGQAASVKPFAASISSGSGQMERVNTVISSLTSQSTPSQVEGFCRGLTRGVSILYYRYNRRGAVQSARFERYTGGRGIMLRNGVTVSPEYDDISLSPNI